MRLVLVRMAGQTPLVPGVADHWPPSVGFWSKMVGVKPSCWR